MALCFQLHDMPQDVARVVNFKLQKAHPRSWNMKSPERARFGDLAIDRQEEPAVKGIPPNLDFRADPPRCRIDMEEAAVCGVHGALDVIHKPVRAVQVVGPPRAHRHTTTDLRPFDLFPSAVPEGGATLSAWDQRRANGSPVRHRLGSPSILRATPIAATSSAPRGTERRSSLPS
ncbi:hypothetical protein GY45DRAFT_1323991 [Cubamyces sp. BRFM 1775]|nr:hypothetical protein GY45DRAFT_1323991 [Cubamyces sp. BRFM 1775]